METPYDKDGTYLNELAEVFGDATRRNVYKRLRTLDEPVSASEMAEPFGLHRTVARAHLEKLVQLGLAETDTRRRAGGGRPAKVYSLTGGRLEIMVPPRRFERLARLLLELIEEAVAPAAAAGLALSVGRRFGEQSARELSRAGPRERSSLAPAEVVAWMDCAGYDVTLSGGKAGVTTVEVHNCVYSELATSHASLVCCFDRGMVCGMLGIEASQHEQTMALANGDPCCRHEFAL